MKSIYTQRKALSYLKEIMTYNQPSFRATHSASVIGYGGGSAGFASVMPKPIYDIKLKPAAWYKRY